MKIKSTTHPSCPPILVQRRFCPDSNICLQIPYNTSHIIKGRNSNKVSRYHYISQPSQYSGSIITHGQRRELSYVCRVQRPNSRRTQTTGAVTGASAGAGAGAGAGGAAGGGARWFIMAKRASRYWSVTMPARLPSLELLV